MMCSNCVEENETVFEVLPEKKYNACNKCSVTYGQNRKKETFVLDEEVFINKYHSKTENRIFIIKEIFIFEECESGRMAHLIDKETGNKLKSVLDINWLLKIKN